MFKSLIVLYQASISYFLGGNCRYYPSCSHYAKQAFETHSFFTAFKLSFFRILSCHPFSKKNYHDPVPAPKTTSEISLRGLYDSKST
ncbi:MAG: membrane protein insertion efficiency factor YidD [Bdellovibrio sp.]|nr:membrane protein insertion efficiency factor YidD [Bdellovibrio sp.]